MNFYMIIKKRIVEVLSDGGRQPLLVCGNIDNRIVFTFDDEWSETAVKTARFVYRENHGKGSLVYRDVPFAGNSVTVPTLQSVSELWVGVTSQDGITTSAARIACVPSIGGFSATAEETEEGETEGSVTAEAVEVTLDLADGDQVVSTDSGNPMSTVTIRKPEALISENIRAGIAIAGVVGTYAPVSTTLAAPTLTLDGGELTISYDAELTEHLLVYADGECISGAYAADEDGSITVDLYGLLAGRDAGTYSITAEAIGGGVRSDFSTAVSYEYDGTAEEEEDATYIVTLGGDGIEISYKIGTSDLSGYAADWDSTLADGTVTTPNGITGLTTSKYVLLYLPEGVAVSDSSNCTVETLSDPQFVQLYGFTESFAVVNFEATETDASEPLGLPTLSLDGTTLVIAQTEGVATQYGVFRSIEPVYNFDLKVTVTATGDETRVDISPYLEVGENYFLVWAYDDETSVGPTTSVGYTLEELTAPTITLDGTLLTITPGAGLATSYKILYSEDDNGFNTATTVEANGSEAVTVDVSEHVLYDPTYFIVDAVNEYTGENAPVLGSVSCGPYSLLISDYNNAARIYYYAVNMSFEEFQTGKYEGKVIRSGVITGLRSGDVLYIRPSIASATFTYSNVSGCTCSYADDTELYVVVSDFSEDAAITLRLQ